MSNQLGNPRLHIPGKITQLPVPLSEAELTEQMTYYLREGPVKELARLFHQSTCPGDWDCQPTATVGSILRTFYERDFGKGELPTASEVTSIIRYRWEICLLADQIVDIFGLPVPGNSMCILWNLGNWTRTIGRDVSDWFWYQSFRIMCGDMYELLPRQPDQGAEFRRPWLYVVAALFEWGRSGKSERETIITIHRIIDFLEVVKRFNKQSGGRVLPVRRNDCVPR